MNSTNSSTTTRVAVLLDGMLAMVRVRSCQSIYRACHYVGICQWRLLLRDFGSSTGGTSQEVGWSDLQKKMIGQKLLPETFNVFCDPTLQTYHGNALNGYYKYDDEGVRAQRVMNVTNGVLTNFLASPT